MAIIHKEAITSVGETSNGRYGEAATHGTPGKNVGLTSATWETNGLRLDNPPKKTKFEIDARAAANRLQKDLAKARSLQNSIKKSDLLKNSATGDMRNYHIKQIQNTLRTTIKKINNHGDKKDTPLLVPLNLIHPTLKASCKANLEIGLPASEINEMLQVEKYNPDLDPNQTAVAVKKEIQEPFLKLLEKSGVEQRKRDWEWRIGEEMEQSQKDGRYPFMGTLTYDRTLFPYVSEDGKTRYETASDMWKQGREVQYHFDAIAREVCTAMGHPAFNRKDAMHPRSYYLQKYAIQEHGKAGTNDHVHYVMWLRDIPSAYKVCPNKGIIDPAKRNRRHCLPLHTHWKWGFSQIDYFRHLGDIWKTKHNFVTPVDKKTGKPMKLRPANEAGGYFVKYISKEEKQWSHRSKATRGLGMARIDAYIQRLTIDQAMALSWRPENYEKHTELKQLHSVPMGLVRVRAKQQIFYLQLLRGEIDPEKEIFSMVRPFQNMVAAVMDGDRPERMSKTDIYNWITKFIPESELYDHSKQKQEFEKLGKYFPPKQKYIGDYVLLGGNSVGN